MDIFYNNQGIPTIIVDGVAHNFHTADKNELLAQLALNPEVIPDIKNKISEYLSSLNWETFGMESKSYSNMRAFLRHIAETSVLGYVIDVLEEAHNMSVMLSVPQPYDSWMWEPYLEKWIPPVAYPDNAPDGVYMWDEDNTEWIPVEQRPHPSWEWNRAHLRYEAPVSYPIDAKDGQFVWDEASRTWVLNDQVG